MHQDATWYVGRPDPRRLCVRWEPSPSPQKGRSPQFSVFVYCGQTAAWIKTPFGTEVEIGLRDIGLHGDPASPALKGHSPQFSANIRCGQTARWSKMPLGMEVGLGPGDFVFDGDPTTPKRANTPPNFWPMSIVAIRLDGSRCHLVRR